MATSPINRLSPEAAALQKIEGGAFIRDAAWISTLLDQVQTQRFHGKLTLIVEKGLVVRAIKEQSLMPPNREP